MVAFSQLIPVSRFLCVTWQSYLTIFLFFFKSGGTFATEKVSEQVLKLLELYVHIKSFFFFNLHSTSPDLAHKPNETPPAFPVFRYNKRAVKWAEILRFRNGGCYEKDSSSMPHQARSL